MCALKKTGRWCLILAGALAFSWLFPQTIFRDCIQVIFTQEESNEREHALTEEDYLDLFHPQKSEYILTWKFLQKD